MTPFVLFCALLLVVLLFIVVVGLEVSERQTCYSRDAKGQSGVQNRLRININKIENDKAIFLLFVVAKSDKNFQLIKENNN